MSPNARDIMSLLMPMFSGTKDEYGKDVVPPLPLSFDRVMEGRPPLTPAPLFRLPYEILSMILQYVNHDSFESLALVNSDCRQMARSAQFDSIRLDYSPQSWGLLYVLSNEAKERSLDTKGSMTSRPAIGSCIRRITVATNSGYFALYHQVELTDDFTNLEEDVQDERMRDAAVGYFDKYLGLLDDVFANPKTLPHIELFDWEDRSPPPRSFFDHLPQSNVQHLKLYRLPLEEEFEINSGKPVGEWCLRSLHLEVYWNFMLGDKGSSSPFCSSILRHCAPNLEMLTWEGLMPVKDLIDVDKHEPLSFPRLRTLSLGHLSFKNTILLEALLNAPLTTLIINYHGDPLVDQCTTARGNIRTLETLVNEGIISESFSLDFLKANQQISTLSFPIPISATLIEDRLLPLLSSSFTALRSLCLTWDEETKTMKESVLQMISTLKGLEQIHLSAGNQWGWRHDWKINHESMREYLSKLPNLKKMAFSRDSYEGSALGLEYYYEDRFPARELVERHPEWDDSLQSQKWLWELGHQQMVLEEAFIYVNMMPKLEWVYFGQLPMEVKDHKVSDEDVKMIEVMSERDDSWTLLRRMFGIKEMI